MSQEEIDRYNAQRAAERGACYFKQCEERVGEIAEKIRTGQSWTQESPTTIPPLHQLVQVLAVGTPVKMHDIPGVIIGVAIYGPDHRSIQYQVAYWNNGTRQANWLHDFEVTVVEDVRDEVSIGFITRSGMRGEL